MITAKTNDGTSITVHPGMKRDKLFRLRKKYSFYCPGCHEPVMLKIGQVKSPHFAHVRKRCDCWSEGETDQHLQGKWLLYQWLQSQNDHVYLEKAIGQTRQRPDLFISSHSSYAIEYQCATIPISIFITRTNQYNQLGICPVWIYGHPLTEIARFPEMVRLNRFQSLFVQYDEYAGFWLCTFSPDTQSFIFYTHLLSITSHKVFTKKMTVPLTRATFPIHPPSSLPSLSALYDHWFQERRYMLQERIRYPHRTDSFLQFLSKKQTTVWTLPLVVGLPLRENLMFTPSVLDWQGYLYFSLIHQRKKGEVCFVQEGTKVLQMCLKRKWLHQRSMPLVSYSLNKAVVSYFNVLTHLHVLKRETKEVYRIIDKPKIPYTLLELEKLEKDIAHRLSKRITHPF
ncbi:competence protein CoiA [Aeribacillus pallidus]|uniref:competence protein CoiA n=1 Tax=Aeribacillus pallidus TaxID=33936 RepID=UPI003D1EB710